MVLRLLITEDLLKYLPSGIYTYEDGQMVFWQNAKPWICKKSTPEDDTTYILSSD